LRGGVRVVDGGKVSPTPSRSAFMIRHLGKASRTGLGLTNDGELLLFATASKVSLTEFGKAMKSRGVRNGVSLDGGSSTAFITTAVFLSRPSASVQFVRVNRNKLPER